MVKYIKIQINIKIELGPLSRCKPNVVQEWSCTKSRCDDFFNICLTKAISESFVMFYLLEFSLPYLLLPAIIFGWNYIKTTFLCMLPWLLQQENFSCLSQCKTSTMTMDNVGLKISLFKTSSSTATPTFHLFIDVNRSSITLFIWVTRLGGAKNILCKVLELCLMNSCQQIDSTWKKTSEIGDEALSLNTNRKKQVIAYE
jgi:hypothetical protein